MYLGVPDRCIRYGDRLSSPEPSNERPSAAFCASPSLVYGNHRIYIRVIEIVMGGSRRSVRERVGGNDILVLIH